MTRSISTFFAAAVLISIAACSGDAKPPVVSEPPAAQDVADAPAVPERVTPAEPVPAAQEGPGGGELPKQLPEAFAQAPAVSQRFAAEPRPTLQKEQEMKTAFRALAVFILKDAETAMSNGSFKELEKSQAELDYLKALMQQVQSQMQPHRDSLGTPVTRKLQQEVWLELIKTPAQANAVRSLFSGTQYQILARAWMEPFDTALSAR